MMNVTLKTGLLALLFSLFLFTSCEDNLMQEVTDQKENAEIIAETDKNYTATARITTGFQGRAYERLSNGGIGSTISGVKITFTKEDGSASYTVHTNSYGSYKISLAAGRYYVLATHWDYEIYNSSPGFFVVTGNDGYQTGNFFLKKLDYGFAGFTYQRNWDNSIGPKLGYVKLTFTKDDGLYSKVIYSSSSGYYKVSLPKGKYFLKAEKSGYWTYDSSPGVGVNNGNGYSTWNIFQKRRWYVTPAN